MSDTVGKVKQLVRRTRKIKKASVLREQLEEEYLGTLEKIPLPKVAKRKETADASVNGFEKFVHLAGKLQDEVQELLQTSRAYVGVGNEVYFVYFNKQRAAADAVAKIPSTYAGYPVELKGVDGDACLPLTLISS